MIGTKKSKSKMKSVLLVSTMVMAMGMSPEDRAKDLVSKMTLQEKARTRRFFFLEISFFFKSDDRTDTLSSRKWTRICWKC